MSPSAMQLLGELDVAELEYLELRSTFFSR